VVKKALKPASKKAAAAQKKPAATKRDPGPSPGAGTDAMYDGSFELPVDSRPASLAPRKGGKPAAKTAGGKKVAPPTKKGGKTGSPPASSGMRRGRSAGQRA
jgi:hypothetical protein